MLVDKMLGTVDQIQVHIRKALKLVLVLLSQQEEWQQVADIEVDIAAAVVDLLRVYLLPGFDLLVLSYCLGVVQGVVSSFQSGGGAQAPDGQMVSGHIDLDSERSCLQVVSCLTAPRAVLSTAGKVRS